MKLRNLQINFSEIDNLGSIVDAIKELETIINDNYINSIEQEVAIEFNIGSRLGEVKEWLVVYANPEYKNNPYVFILKQSDQDRILSKETDISSFKSLSDYWTRKNVNKTIAIGFQNLPKYAFLGERQIAAARTYAKNYDDFER